MAQQIAADGGTGPRTDSRLEKVDKITIDFETFKKTLKRNYLGEPDRWGRNYVLRLYPPFNAEMEAEYYESEQGVHYDNNWDEKPFHINPELLILEGPDSRGTFFNNHEWPTASTERYHLSDDEIEDAGGIEAVVEESREWFWNEIKHALPETFDLGNVHGFGSYKVDVEWVFEDDQ